MTADIGRISGIGQPWQSVQAADPPVRAFVDLSNIWGGVREAAAAHGESSLPIRLSAANLARVLRAGRADFQLTTVANADVPTGVIRRFESVGEVIRRESGHLTHTEQANDETLQVRMYESIHTQPQAVLVLATGDGAGWIQGRGFVPVLDVARTLGWAVEVVAWGTSTNRKLREWAATERAPFVDLDDYYYSVTFVEGGRFTQPVLLTHRRTAEPAGRQNQ